MGEDLERPRLRALEAFPVEQDGGSGTAGSHWDEETFGNELMTGYVNTDDDGNIVYQRPTLPDGNAAGQPVARPADNQA